MPLKSQLHVNQLLSNVSVKYSNAEYKWDKIFPAVMVGKDTDLYRVYDRNFKIPETKRAAKGVAREFGFEVSTASYALEQHALKDYIGVDEQENYDQENLKLDATEYLTDAIYRRIEKSVADLFTTTSFSLNVSLAAANAFNANTTVSDPVPVFDTGASTVIANSGKVPNFGILPHAAFIAVKNHTSVLDRVKYTSSEVSEAMIASLLGLAELHVPTAIYDSAADGLAATNVNFYGDIAFLGWKPASAGRKTPSVGYTFMRDMPRVRSWFDEERNADVVEVEIKYQPKIVASLCGYLIKDVI